MLTHLCLAFHKGTVANSVYPDQTPQMGRSGSTLLALNTGISTKQVNNKSKPDTPSTGNEPVKGLVQKIPFGISGSIT